MSGIESWVVDTNILIRLLNGDIAIQNLLKDKYLVVSFITEMELLCKKNLSVLEIEQIKNLLADCQLVNIDKYIKALAINTRMRFGLKLPDAIIVATATSMRIPFLTGDSDLKAIAGLVMIICN